ncbi:MAG TPA: HDOD domain-containing protein [Anaeromyxobacter sp.]
MRARRDRSSRCCAACRGASHPGSAGTPEYAFLCGLLHDVGIAGILLALAEDPRWKGVSFEELEPVLVEVHAEASAILCRLWRLPEAIQTVVSSQHEVTPAGRAEPVRAALVVAEQLAWEARKVLKIDELAFCAARAEAFEIVERLGPAGTGAASGAPAAAARAAGRR